MPSFGEKLKQERVKRSITLEQISLSTKIGTRMLQALEEDKFTQLPGGIFNKGFVRAYARHVGLDEDQTVADYLEASGESVPAPAPEIKPETPRPERPAPPSRPLPWGLFAALLLLVALALALWNRRQHTPEEIHSQPAATQKTADGASPAPASPQSPAQSDANVDDKVSSQASTPTKSPARPPVTSAKPSDEAVPAPSAPQAGQFTVVILAREESWLSVTADGKAAFTETLLAGDQRAIHARSQIVLKSGNTGALDFVFNGKKLPSQGAYGEVKTLTFGVAGLEPAPSAPPGVQ